MHWERVPTVVKVASKLTVDDENIRLLPATSAIVFVFLPALLL